MMVINEERKYLFEKLHFHNVFPIGDFDGNVFISTCTNGGRNVLDNLLYPPDCAVVIAMHHTHRDPAHWEVPNDFHPEHFLPEAVESRSPYAYIPFSGGFRGCIGEDENFKPNNK